MDVRTYFEQIGLAVPSRSGPWSRRAERRRRPRTGIVSGGGPESNLPTRLPRALRALAHDAVVAEVGPYPLAVLGAVAATFEERRSCRPCHPRATSSGHQRYPADSHGYFEEAVGLAAQL
jgi:hypothetical protein